jgi:hypothetical protein
MLLHAAAAAQLRSYMLQHTHGMLDSAASVDILK